MNSTFSGTLEFFRLLEGAPLGNQFPLFKVMADAKSQLGFFWYESFSCTLMEI